MNEFMAAILGLVEGLTEFLPVSSTGHLILAGRWLGFEERLGQEAAANFEVVIQLGAILAVVAAYPHRFIGLLDNRRPQGFRGGRGIALLICTSLPILAIGALAHDAIKTRLFNPWSVAAALAVGAVWILAMERRKPALDQKGESAAEAVVKTENVDSIGWSQALGIGLFQCLALWPGMSRSASTILGGMMLGLDRKAATEYSFYAAVPVICAAALADLAKSYGQLSSSRVALLGIGLVVSFISAFVAVKWLLQFVSNHTLIVFAWYRLALAAIVLWAMSLPPK